MMRNLRKKRALCVVGMLWRACLMGLWVGCFLLGVAHAQRMQNPLTQAEGQGHFGRLAIPIRGGKTQLLETRRLTVRVKIQGRMARTEVEQVFYNPTSTQAEGTYTFRLPYHAAIVRLAMDVNGRLMEGEIVERTKARAVYGSIVRSMKDPALLEWQGNNRFRTQIFPIPARGTKRIILGYDHVLTRSAGKIEYVYHLPAKGSKLRIGTFGMRIEIAGRPGVRVTPYDVSNKRARGKTVLNYRAKKFSPRGQFVVRIASKTVRGRLYAGALKKRQFGMLEIPIHLKGPRKAYQKRVLLVDTSAGMTRRGLDKAIAVSRQLLETLSGQARFGVVVGDIETQRFRGRLSRSSRVGEAMRFLGKQRPRGATHLERLLLDGVAHAGSNAEIIYIGDGSPSVGLMDADLLVAAVLKARGSRSLRISAIGIGPSPDMGLLGKITRATGGRLIRLQIGQQPELIASRLLGLLKQPQLTDVKYSVEGMKDIVRLYDGNVASGESLILAGEMTAKAVKLKLTGRVDQGRSFAFNEVFEPVNDRSKPIVPAFWAKTRISRLEKESSKRKEIIALSQQFGVMSRYTSFLVLENDKAYKQHQIARNQDKKRVVREQEKRIARLRPSRSKGNRAKQIQRWMRAGRQSEGRADLDDAARAPSEAPGRLQFGLRGAGSGGGGTLRRPRRSRRSRRARRARRFRIHLGGLPPTDSAAPPAPSAQPMSVPVPKAEPAPATGDVITPAPKKKKKATVAKKPKPSLPSRLTLVTTPARAKVYLDGRYVGRTPLVLAVERGRTYKLKFVKGCYLVKKMTLVLGGSEQRKKVKIKLKRDPRRACRTGASLPGFQTGRRVCGRAKTHNWKKEWLRRHRRRIASRGRVERLARLRQAIKKEPMSWNLREQYYWALLRRGKRKAALAALQEWRQYAPEDKGLIIRESRLLRKLGQVREARRVLSELVEFAPQDYAQRIRYAQELQQQGTINQACEQFGQAVRLNPAQRNTFQKMMGLYRARQKNKEFRDIIEACIVKGVSRLPVVRDVSLVMFWDDPSADVDLHIHEPGGGHVSYRKRESAQGGTLYYDITNGLGPEIYVLGNAKKGKYKISIVYYRGSPRVITGRLVVMRHAGSPKETRKVFRFKLHQKYGKKEIDITNFVIK